MVPSHQAHPNHDLTTNSKWFLWSDDGRHEDTSESESSFDEGGEDEDEGESSDDFE